jgi:hypothetical protein
LPAIATGDEHIFAPTLLRYPNASSSHKVTRMNGRISENPHAFAPSRVRDSHPHPASDGPSAGGGRASTLTTGTALFFTRLQAWTNRQKPRDTGGSTALGAGPPANSNTVRTVRRISSPEGRSKSDQSSVRRFFPASGAVSGKGRPAGCNFGSAAFVIYNCVDSVALVRKS